MWKFVHVHEAFDVIPQSTSFEFAEEPRAWQQQRGLHIERLIIEWELSSPCIIKCLLLWKHKHQQWKGETKFTDRHTHKKIQWFEVVSHPERTQHTHSIDGKSCKNASGIPMMIHETLHPSSVCNNCCSALDIFFRQTPTHFFPWHHYVAQQQLPAQASWIEKKNIDDVT